jgi:hypothetical protein
MRAAPRILLWLLSTPPQATCLTCLALQDVCLRLMLQRLQYSGAAGLMRAVLHVRGIPPLGLIEAFKSNTSGLY